MLETSGIHDKVTRARRRLRLQSAMEAATIASIPTSVVALTAVYLVRLGAVSGATGAGLLFGCVGILLAGAVIGWARRFPTAVVATRIDRASALSDRLASACAFEETLAAGEAIPAETEALMHAAIRDAARALPRADVAAATRFSRPRDSRAAMLVAAAAIAVGGLALPRMLPFRDVQVVGAVGRGTGRPSNPVVLDRDDVDYARSIVDDLHRTARQTGDADLDKLADQLDKTIDKAKRGEITKTALLEALETAERAYMQGSKAEAKASLAELKKTGRLLEKTRTTRALGKALRRGDLGAAKKEFQKLAAKIEHGKLSDKQRAQAAKALARAAKAFDARQKQRDATRAHDIASTQRALSRLRRRLQKAHSQAQKSRLTRRIQDKQRRLKRLRRQQQQQRSAQARRLKRLYRNLREAASSMRRNDAHSRRMASEKLRVASQQTDGVRQEIRKITNRARVASQLTNLKQALRRARRKRSRGPQDLFGKNRRESDYRRRALGQPGQRGAWKPGARRLARGMNGSGKLGPNGRAVGPDRYGDQHDPNVLGDPTRNIGKTKDTSMQGVQGRGPSRRQAILAAADKGFASRAYHQVYTQYRSIVENVMHEEKVPSGYKYYIERYFQKIKPRD